MTILDNIKKETAYTKDELISSPEQEEELGELIEKGVIGVLRIRNKEMYYLKT